MKPSFKFVCVIALLLFITRNSLARPINRIDSFETTSGIIFGIDKYCKIDRTNEYSTDGKFSVKLSFNTNYPNATQNFFLPVMSINKKSDESLLFDVYNKSSDDIILFCKVFLAGNKYVEQSTKLIKHKKTTVEIPFALARENFNTISGYQFRITNSTKNTIIYFDNFRTELSSYIPFKKIAYLDLNNEPLQTNTFFFSRNTSGQVFKDTIPLPFEKVYKIKLFAAKGEELYYSLSFRTCKKQNKVSISLSDFISNNSNKLSLTTSIGKVGYLDKRLSYDSKFFIADMPLYILKGNCFTNLSSKATRTFQFTLNIPDSAIPGTYFANVIFETINGVLTNRNLIPVSLDVYPFSVNKKSLSNNFILNCDLESIKPELNRYASGFFKVIGGSNNIVKSLPQIILGDAFDDFDCDAGDRISVYLTNQISIARYAVNIGNNDLNYFNILKYWLKKARKQKIQSREIDESQDDIKYLINSLKTTPPLNIASKWTAMLTKEQVSLTGVSYDSNAIAFITGEQKLPNGWTAKDYDRARMMIANDIIKLMKEKFGLDPYVYIPSKNHREEKACISYFIPVIYSNAKYTYHKIQSCWIDKMLIKLSRIITGRYLYYCKQKSAIISVLVLINSLAKFNLLKSTRFIFRAMPAKNSMKGKRLVFENTPVINSNGEINCCEFCPNLTVRDKKIVPVCLADHKL